jgi:TonB family protein
MRLIAFLGLTWIVSGQAFERPLNSTDGAGVQAGDGAIFRAALLDRVLQLGAAGAAFSGELWQDAKPAPGTEKPPPGSWLVRNILHDSKGRNRYEYRLIADQNPPTSPVVVEILDQAAGDYYALDTINHVAHHLTFRSPSAPASPPPPNPGSTLVQKDLGTRTIEGLRVDGIQITSALTDTAGKLTGRIATQERWTSPELGIALVLAATYTDGPTQILRLTNIRRSEPEISQFQVPPGYSVRAEAGDFMIWYPQDRPAPALPRMTGPGSGPITNPKILKQVEPRYTKEARAKHIEGTVELALVVEKDGTVSHIRVLSSLDPGLETAAIQAVQKWKFEPARRNGETVAMTATIQVNFRLGKK